MWMALWGGGGGGGANADLKGLLKRRWQKVTHKYGQGAEASLGAAGQITKGFVGWHRNSEFLSVKWGATAGSEQEVKCSDLQRTER